MVSRVERLLTPHDFDKGKLIAREVVYERKKKRFSATINFLVNKSRYKIYFGASMVVTMACGLFERDAIVSACEILRLIIVYALACWLDPN